jgi:hypothetical protein
MAITNQERVGKALDLFRTGLAPFVEREFANAHQDKALVEARRLLPAEDRINANRPIAQWDAAALLKLIWDARNEVFGRTLGRAERSLVQELRDMRNRWAHQDPFTVDDIYCALNSVHRLLLAISSTLAEEVEKMKMELLRVRFDEQARSEKRKTASTAIERAVAGSLQPWREVVTPHQDVASGRYQQADFAADLTFICAAELGDPGAGGRGRQLAKAKLTAGGDAGRVGR